MGAMGGLLSLIGALVVGVAAFVLARGWLKKLNVMGSLSKSPRADVLAAAIGVGTALIFSQVILYLLAAMGAFLLGIASAGLLRRWLA